jgi:ubiquinone/menaquinone biosynthesis C-methylase UbiE
MEIPAAGDPGLLIHTLTKTLTIEKHLSVNAATAGKIFAEQYFLLRKKEHRIYTDDELLSLPKISKTHTHYKEWRIREASCKRLLHYLKNKQAPLNILEVGCGNGWLSAQMATINNSTVTGIDINTEELKQAQRVFAATGNLSFSKGELNNTVLKDKLFDIIVFAASVQYFPSVKKIINTALSRLTLQGEIHIMDSVFYKKEEVVPASLRTKEYFTALRFPQMTDYYFHHNIDTLQQFHYKVLHNPSSLVNRILPGNNPFYHIVITGKK